MKSYKEKHDALDRVLKSKTFSKTTTNNLLLKFLFEATLQKKEISTVTIGLELFGTKYNPEKNDVNIRVNISHLRKRLSQYYENEGIYDPIVISIEPGQYLVSFTPKTELLQRNKKRKIFLGLIFLLIVITTGAIIYRGSDKNKVWNQLVQNRLETTLYIGDVFGYSAPTEFNNNGWHRDSRINSVKEFYELVNEDPEKYGDLKPAEFGYVVFENAYNIKPFTQYFTRHNYDFTIRPTTDFITRSIKDQNTIYAGPLFAQDVMNELFNDFANNIRLDEKKGLYNQYFLTHLKEQEKSINLQLNSSSGEFAIASAFNGPNNSRHYMFFSNHGMGLTAIVEYFTNTDSLQAFSNRYLSKSNEFIAVYYVKGKDRTNISMEQVFFDDNK